MATVDGAANMAVRKELVEAINHRIAANGWTQQEAAHHIGVSQPRISHLARHQHQRFSVDALLKIAAAVGLIIEITIKDPQ